MWLDERVNKMGKKKVIFLFHKPPLLRAKTQSERNSYSFFSVLNEYGPKSYSIATTIIFISST